jgi:hypothetical protein
VYRHDTTPARCAKKEQKFFGSFFKKELLFEKRSKNFCSLGGIGTGLRSATAGVADRGIDFLSALRWRCERTAWGWSWKSQR